MPLRPTRVLLGHMPLADADRYLRGRSPDVPADAREFGAFWKRFNDATAGGPPPDLDAAPKPLEASHHANELVNQPAFKAAVAKHHWALQTVRIDALLCTQRRVDEGFAALSTGGVTPTDPQRIREVALPLDRDPRPVETKVEGKTVTVSYDSPDLRLIGPVHSYDPATDRTTVGFTVGWGSPFVTVSRIGERHFLKNGYHRVFGLRARGVERVPAVVLEAARLEDTGAGRPGFFGAEALESARPPTVAAFFDDGLSVSVRVPTSTKRFRVTVEESVVREGQDPS